MQIRLFGTIEARDGNGSIALGSLPHYRVLGVLALNLGNVVRTDHLLQALDSDLPGPLSRRAIQNVIMRIRKAIPREDDVCVLTVGSGYVLNAAPETVDLYRAVALIHRSQCEDDTGEADSSLESAMEMWHEPLFGWLATPAMRAMAEKKISLLLDSEYTSPFDRPASVRWP
ncbi:MULTISPECIES: AfsR/SARP family transcriptional regulator [Amycolatopsis]|uniref:OmpR/PhoB-type domain-containing protein n=1 Tax=Amycolatopsis albidoflavus TaxID=102226 RepID=A0ABW5I7Q8_9PSEU